MWWVLIEHADDKQRARLTKELDAVVERAQRPASVTRWQVVLAPGRVPPPGWDEHEADVSSAKAMSVLTNLPRAAG